MPTLSDFGRLIQDINQQLESGLIRNANEANRAIADISEAMQGLTLPGEARQKAEELIQLLTVLRDALVRMGDEGERSAEKMRRGLESVVGQNKQLIELIKMAIGDNQALADTVADVSRAFSTLKREGDIGRMVQQFTASIPVVKWFGFFVGEAVSAFTKFQDRIQLVNRSLIEAQASLGKFGEGMQQANTMTADLSVGIAEYAQLTGASTDEVKGWITQLGKAGFALENMGINEQTGHIISLNEALDDSSAGFGALSSTLGLARFAGLEFGQVADQMRMQVKALGDDTKDVVDTFIGLSTAAERSKLSTSILLPLLRSMQEQFKFVGIDSNKAAGAIGAAAEAAAKAGFGPEVGAQVLQQVVSGILRAPFGIQAFLGQQLGMGAGGLTAGFALRQEAGQEPLDVAMGVARAARRFFGGRAVSPEQARTSQELAAIRLGQEQFIMQMMGLSQLEAKSYLDTVAQLEKMDVTGELDSQARKEAEERLKALSMTEKDWRAKTLTLQEKMARFLELIYTTVGRVFIGLIRGLARGGAGAFGGAADQFLAAISRGEGIDHMTDEMWKKGIQAIGHSLTKGSESLGEKLGGALSWLTSSSEDTTASIRGMGEASREAADAIKLIGLGTKIGEKETAIRQLMADYFRISTGRQAAMLGAGNIAGQVETPMHLRRAKDRGDDENAFLRWTREQLPQVFGPGGREYEIFIESERDTTQKLKELNDIYQEQGQKQLDKLGEIEKGLGGLPVEKREQLLKEFIRQSRQLGGAGGLEQIQGLEASLGIASGEDIAGVGIGNTLSRIQGKAQNAATSPATKGGRTSTEHELVFHVKGVDEKMNILIDERIAYNIEQDKILPGKLGKSALRHGSSYRGYS